LLNEEQQEEEGDRNWDDAVDDRGLGNTDARHSARDRNGWSKDPISHRQRCGEKALHSFRVKIVMSKAVFVVYGKVYIPIAEGASGDAS